MGTRLAKRIVRLIFLAVAVGASALLSQSGARAGEAQTAPDVVTRTLSFSIENVNRSLVPCHSDGKPYELSAELAMPAKFAHRDRVPSITLYVHGLGLSSYYWQFQSVPGYDHVTEMARLGHAGLVYDRLGYGQNPKPLGTDTCYGSDADIAAQLARKLKSGDYAISGGQPVAFDRVVVASHSQAGLIAQPMAYSFNDADALVITSWTDEHNRQEVSAEVIPTAQVCLTGGEQPPSGERPPFYAYFPQDPATLEAFYFHNADPAVVDAAIGLREPDPCGQGGSLAQTLVADNLHLGDINVPVLLAYGMNDAYRPQPIAGESHADRFTGSSDVTVEFLENTGNAIVLEKNPQRFRAMLARWLCERDFADRITACGRQSGAPAIPAGVTPAPVAQPRGVPVLPTTGADSAMAPTALAMLGLGVLGLGVWPGRSVAPAGPSR